MDKKPNRNARALSKLGASKGGKARANVLTPEERSEIARRAVRTRWAKQKGIPLEEYEQVSNSTDLSTPVVNIEATLVKNTSSELFSMFRGDLELGTTVKLPCHVLNDGRRVIAQREVVGLLTGHVKGGIARYLQSSALKNYIKPDLIEKQTVCFKVPGTNQRATGYDGTLVVEICDAYLKARDDNALGERHENLVKRAEIFMRACAKVGIIALIDEATGYQKVRSENALRLKLQAFIAEDMQEWVRMFPPEFFEELARLENIRYSPRNRPIRWGKYVMAFVYAAVDKDVAKALKERIPNPHYRQNLHQLLRDFGKEKVTAQVYQVLGVMKTCRDMDEFRQKFAYIFKKEPYQLTFFDLVDSYQAA
jgi:hypothetical protein